jgi:hypothetical protein
MKQMEDEATTNDTKLMTLPSEIMIDIFTFVPYRKLIRSICLVNHCFHDVILGTDGTSFWQQLCKHQSIEFNVNTLQAQSFVTKYQPPNIKFFTYGGTCNQGTTFELIEPFVTTLSFEGVYDRYQYEEYFSDYYECIDRPILPSLTRLDFWISFETLMECFGTDLSRVKKLMLCQTDNNISDIKFGSLENLSLDGTFDSDILQHNLNTLHTLDLWITHDTSNCLELVAPTISNLTINISNEVVLKQITFSQLRQIYISARLEQVVQFFSVTHPLLAKVNLIELDTHPPVDISLAQQPSIRYITCGTSIQLMKALLKVVDHKVVVSIEVHTEQLATNEIDLSSFSKLEKLNINPSNCSNTENVMKQNNILSCLTLSEEFNIQPVLSYLSNLRYLDVNTLDESTLSKVMKLPLLNTLKVNTLTTTYEYFTKLLIESSNIKNYSIGLFEENSVNHRMTYIIPPLKSLNIDLLNSYFYSSGTTRWILFVTSTMNVHEVNYSVLERTTEELLSEYKSKNQRPSNFTILPIIQYLIKSLKNIVETDKYLKLNNDLEKKMILDKFETLFQEKENTRHPVLEYLIQQAQFNYN